MTRLTQKEWDALLAYNCSVPTFHEAWLNPGRWWRVVAGTYNNRENLICCYVEAGPRYPNGDLEIGIMTDLVEIV
jgi:hypothetical protein